MGIYTNPFDFSPKKEDTFELDLTPGAKSAPSQDQQPWLELLPASVAGYFLMLFEGSLNPHMPLKHVPQETNHFKFIEIIDRPQPFDFSPEKEDNFELDVTPDTRGVSYQEPLPKIELLSSGVARHFLMLLERALNLCMPLKQASQKTDHFNCIEVVDQPVKDPEFSHLSNEIKSYINRRITTVTSLEELYKEVFDTAMYMLQECGIEKYIREKVSRIYDGLDVHLTPAHKRLLDESCSSLTTSANKADVFEKFCAGVEQLSTEIQDSPEIHGLNNHVTAMVRWARWWLNTSKVASIIASYSIPPLSIVLYVQIGLHPGVFLLPVYITLAIYKLITEGNSMYYDWLFRKIVERKVSLKNPAYKPEDSFDKWCVSLFDEFLFSITSSENLRQFKPQLKGLLSYVKYAIAVEMYKKETGAPSLMQKELQDKLREQGDVVLRMNEHIEKTIDTEMFFLLYEKPKQPFIDRWREIANDIAKNSEQGS